MGDSVVNIQVKATLPTPKRCWPPPATSSSELVSRVINYQLPKID
jgi:hypothetical protein